MALLKKQTRFINQRVLAPVFYKMYEYTNSLSLITIIRRVAKIQLKKEQILQISRRIKENKNCKLLIFGMGNDSKYWILTNKSGKTFFIEDNPHWFNEMKKKNPEIEGGLVTYNTKKKQWRTLLNDEEALQLELPEAIRGEIWDIVFVDAPRGVEDNSPGRMKSIYMASRLVKKGGVVFVHDCNREVETEYNKKYLKEENLSVRIGSLDEYLIV